MSKKRSVIHFFLLWLQSSRQILMSTICLVPTLLGDLQSGPNNEFHYPQRRGSLQNAQVMGPNYTARTPFLVGVR